METCPGHDELVLKVGAIGATVDEIDRKLDSFANDVKLLLERRKKEQTEAAVKKRGVGYILKGVAFLGTLFAAAYYVLKLLAEWAARSP